MTEARNKPERPECPKFFTIEFARELIEYLGGDPTPIEDDWYWEEFARTYPELRKKAERYFESAQTGDPSWAACHMHRCCGSSQEWAERVIENARTGDPAIAAYQMHRFCGSSHEWAERVIESAQVGNPDWAASKMVHFHGSSPKWAKSIKRRWEKEQKNNG